MFLYLLVIYQCDAGITGMFSIPVYNSENDIEEGDITQSACSGSGGGVSPPGPPTKNHRGRVGYINVFEWGTGSCEINEFTGEWYY